MPITDLRQTVLSIVNTVQRRLGLNTTATLFATKHATMLTELLNEVVDEVSDAGNWMELFRETTVLASSSVEEYTLDPATGLVKNVYEIHFGSSRSALEVVEIQDIRRLQRGRSFGVPRQFAITGVNASSANPLFRTYPIPGSSQNNQTFQVAYYTKPALFTASADGGTTPGLPAAMLIQGLYAKALLEENGGEPTKQYETAFAIYERMKREALNRFNADTGTDLRLIPGGSRW